MEGRLGLLNPLITCHTNIIDASSRDCPSLQLIRAEKQYTSKVQLPTVVRTNTPQRLQQFLVVVKELLCGRIDLPAQKSVAPHGLWIHFINRRTQDGKLIISTDGIGIEDPQILLCALQIRAADSPIGSLRQSISTEKQRFLPGGKFPNVDGQHMPSFHHLQAYLRIHGNVEYRLALRGNIRLRLIRIHDSLRTKMSGGCLFCLSDAKQNHSASKSRFIAEGTDSFHQGAIIHPPRLAILALTKHILIAFGFYLATFRTLIQHPEKLLRSMIKNGFHTYSDLNPPFLLQYSRRLPLFQLTLSPLHEVFARNNRLASLPDGAAARAIRTYFASRRKYSSTERR